MIRLECTTGGHNKFYEFHLARTNGRVTLKGLYGGIGKAPQETIIYDGDSEGEAQAELLKKQAEKQKKGYVMVGSNGSLVQDPVQKKKNDLPVIWPMNAQGVKDTTHLDRLLNDTRFIAQEKLDGMRAIVHITPTGLRIFSRSAGVDDPSRPLEKTSSLPHLASLRFPGLVGTIVDCEILARGMNSAELAGTVHRKTGTNGNHHVQLFVFDILAFCDTDLSHKKLSERLNWLKALKSRLLSEHIHFLPWAETMEDKERLYASVLSEGGEGIMLKCLDEYYLQGGRPTNNWFKVKKSMTIDAVVLGFTKGKGKFNNRIGALVFGQYVNTPEGWTLQELGQTSGMSDEVRAQMSLLPNDYIGRVVTIKGMERLKSGAIRHPQFVAMRLDKNPDQCRWYEGEQ
jgi:ATP-dependent DNA ligase